MTQAVDTTTQEYANQSIRDEAERNKIEYEFKKASKEQDMWKSIMDTIFQR